MFLNSKKINILNYIISIYIFPYTCYYICAA